MFDGNDLMRGPVSTLVFIHLYFDIVYNIPLHNKLYCEIIHSMIVDTVIVSNMFFL